MFGTNYPMITAATVFEGLGSLALSDETKAAFLSGIAAKVFALA